MPESKYLSVDPHAGLGGDEGSGEGRYLSTDPNAGEDAGQDDGENDAISHGAGSSIPPGLVTGAAMKAVPGIVGAVHQGAKVVGQVVTHAGKVGRYAPAVVAYDVAQDVLAGNPTTAAKKVAGAAAVAAVPGVIGRIEKATRPTAGVTRGAGGRFVAGAATPLRRAAGVMSRAAGPVGLAVETIFGEGAAGHASYDPNETTAERQARFEREYAELVEASRRAPAGSLQAGRIRERLNELMSMFGQARIRR